MDIRKHIQSNKGLVKANLLNSFGILQDTERKEFLIKAKAYPVGYINKWDEMKMPDGNWKYVGKKGKSHPLALELQNQGHTITSHSDTEKKKEVTGNGILFSKETTIGNPIGTVAVKSGVVGIKIGDNKWVNFYDFIDSWKNKNVKPPKEMMDKLSLNSNIYNDSTIAAHVEATLKHLKEFPEAVLPDEEVEKKVEKKSTNKGSFSEKTLSVVESVSKLSGYEVSEHLKTVFSESNESEIRELLNHPSLWPHLKSFLNDINTHNSVDKENGLEGPFTTIDHEFERLYSYSVATEEQKKEYRYHPKPMKHADFSNCTPLQIGLIYDYTGSGYRMINSFLLGKYEFNKDKNSLKYKIMNALVQEMNQGIKNIKNNPGEADGMVYRTLNFRTGNIEKRSKEKMVDYLMNMNQEVSENMFLSTSNLANETFGPSNENHSISYEINNANNAGKIIKDISQFYSESEVLFPLDTSYMVTGIAINKNTSTEKKANNHVTLMAFQNN